MTSESLLIDNSVVLDESVKTFNKNYHGGILSLVSPEDIPEPVMHCFENMSRRFIKNEEYSQGNFENFFMLVHESLEKSYITQQQKKYSSGNIEHLTYIIDLSTDKNIIGRGEIRFAINNTEPFFLDKPFVGWNGTEGEYREKGYGKRRLLVMGALTDAFYKRPLHSDTLFCHPAINSMWDGLVEKGLAKSYSEYSNYSKQYRYCFL